MIFFCLSQIRVGWKQTIVVVRSLWAKQPLNQEGFFGGAVRPFGLTFPSWCVGGDFNVIRRRSEKLGGSGFTSSMRDLMVLLENANYMIPHYGMPLLLGQTCKSHRCVRNWISFSIQMSGSFPSFKAFKKFFLDGHRIIGRLYWIPILSSGV